MFDAFRNNSEPVIQVLTEKLNAVVPVPGGTDLAKKSQNFIACAKVYKEKLETWNKKPPIDPYIAVMNAAGYNVKAIKNFHRALFNELNTMALVGYIPVLIADPSEDHENDSLENDFLF